MTGITIQLVILIAALKSKLLVRERSALSDPYCHLAWNSVCLCVCVRNFEVKYLGNQRT